MISEWLYTSNSDEWETPDYLYKKLDNEFHFDLDPCATEHNHKTEEYFTIDNDGLSKNWGGHRVWCNPPYSEIIKWAQKAFEESLKPNTLVVLLAPSRTDTKWFHDYVYHHSEIRFVKGRVKFSGSKWNAPFPSLLAIYRGRFDKKHDIF